jgi:hypothetical protein
VVGELKTGNSRMALTSPGGPENWQEKLYFDSATIEVVSDWGDKINFKLIDR